MSKVLTEKETQKLKREHALHVNIVMVAEECSKNAAQFTAWLEGPEGLKKRLEGATLAKNEAGGLTTAA